MPGYRGCALTFYPGRIMRIRYNVWHYSPVAQSVERLAVNQLVAGSSPARGASQKPSEAFLAAFSLWSLVEYSSCVRGGSYRATCAPAPAVAAAVRLGSSIFS